MKRLSEDGVDLVYVPCCTSCNNLLGSKLLLTPLDRASYLVGVLESRYEKEVSLWSEDEIAEMSDRFQKMIRARKALARVLLGRVRSAQWRVIAEQARM